LLRDATVEDERIVEGTTLATLLNRIVIKKETDDKKVLDCPMFCWDKVIKLLWAELSTFYTPTRCFISMWSTFLWRRRKIEVRTDVDAVS
jgi:hypothetical protein